MLKTLTNAKVNLYLKNIITKILKSQNIKLSRHNGKFIFNTNALNNNASPANAKGITCLI